MVPPGATVAVAFSGGGDSTALLHATCHAAQALGLRVVALHVHHGLLPEADAWARWGAALCRRWAARGLPLRWHCERLATRPGAGDSVEAWARRERYRALAAMARQEGAGLILLGQHRRDQAETVLLQALRGAGPAGLAAMPAVVEREQLVWARPWLDWPREAVAAYVRRHRLKVLQDPSNDDPRWARSRLRSKVWPTLLGAFADAEISLAALARRAQEAAAVLDEIAALDLQGVSDAAALDVTAWRGLSPARRANALRRWLRERQGRGPAETLVQRLLLELGPGPGRWPLDAASELVLQRGRLTVARCQAMPVALSGVLHCDLSRPGVVLVPDWGGRFEVAEVARGHGQGLAPPLLAEARLQARRGGERFQLAPRGLPRGLKKQYQAMAVPARDRHGPLLWSGDRLLYVPGLGTDARAWAAQGEAALMPRWVADDAAPVALQGDR